MIVSLFWFSAGVGIVYDFVRYISRETGLTTIWRRIFESIVLVMSATYSWVWMEDWQTEHPLCLLVGHVLIVFSLVSYIYSSYRKTILVLWLDLVVNCFLVTALALTIGFSLFLNHFAMGIFMGLPVNILFIHALLVNYNILRARNLQRTT
ncbi:MAG TPA: hypothetical protein VGN00_03330 [Puia sp.]